LFLDLTFEVGFDVTLSTTAAEGRSGFGGAVSLTTLAAFGGLSAIFSHRAVVEPPCKVDKDPSSAVAAATDAQAGLEPRPPTPRALNVYILVLRSGLFVVSLDWYNEAINNERDIGGMNSLLTFAVECSA